MPITALVAGNAGSGLAATVSLTWPTGVAIDDVAIAFFETTGESTAAHTPAATSGITGWTAVTTMPRSDIAANSGSRLYAYVTQLTSASPATATFGAAVDHWTGRIVVFRGVDPIIYDATPISAIKTTASATQTTPPITTVTPGAAIVSIATRPDDSASTAHFGTMSNASLTGVATLGESGTQGGNGGGTVVGWGIKTTPGPSGTGTRSKSVQTTDVTLVLALRPLLDARVRSRRGRR